MNFVESSPASANSLLSGEILFPTLSLPAKKWMVYNFYVHKRKTIYKGQKFISIWWSEISFWSPSKAWLGGGIKLRNQTFLVVCERVWIKSQGGFWVTPLTDSFQTLNVSKPWFGSLHKYASGLRSGDWGHGVAWPMCCFWSHCFCFLGCVLAHAVICALAEGRRFLTRILGYLDPSIGPSVQWTLRA